MQEIVRNIFTWSWFSEPHGYNFNGYLIRDAGGNICIDPVEPTEAVLDAIVQEGVAKIILTNRNHSRASNQVRALTGAQTVIHAEDADHAGSQGAELDDALAIGDLIGPLEVVDAAGKSPGEVALYWRGRGILIVGDAIIGNPSGQCGVLPERVIDDLPHLRSSVLKFLDIDFDILLFGDGECILKDAKSRLKELAETFPN